MYKSFFKRIFDILFSLLFLPFVLLIISFLVIIMKIHDSGPIFYNALRVGQYGKTFRMFKIRTMVVNAPDIRLEDGSTFNSTNDPRLTKIGKILRQSSLDELPQVFNVLFGQMSFIGPRPDPIDWLEKYNTEQRVFLNVKPGISGYSQAYYRNSVDGATKIINDVYYAKNVTFILDVRILVKTILTIFFRKNLYINESRNLR